MDLTQLNQLDALNLERFQFMMAGTTDGLWDWNLETDEVYYSPRWFGMLGYETDELPATLDTWKRLVHPEDRDRVLQTAAEFISGESDKFEPEMRMYHKNGSEIFVLSRATKVFSESGDKPVRLIGTHIDITERKIAVQQRIESEKSYHELFNSLNEAVYILDDKGRFLDVNQGAVKMYGFPQSYFLDKSAADLSAPGLNDLRNLGRQLSLAMQGEPQRMEFWAFRSDKSVFPKEVHLYSGTYLGRAVVIAVARDITEQKKAEAQLKQQIDFQSQILEQASEGIVLWELTEDDKFVRFLVWNRRMQEITGYTKEEINQLGWLETMYPDLQERAKARKTMLKALLGSPNKGTDFEILSKKGESKQLYINSKRILGENNKPNVLAIIQDFTKRKFLEEQLRHSQKMEAIGTLVGGIAHDFNNMLGALQGNIYLAKLSLKEHPSALQRLEKIKLLSNRAAETVEQLLTFARKDGLRKSTFNLNTLIQETHELSKTLLPGNISHEITLCEHPLYIKGNVAQLQQVLLNLLNNAIDALEKTKKPKISCKLMPYKASQNFLKKHPELRGTHFAKVCISDNGDGIGPQYLEKIFEPFFTTKEVGKGTGLGLSMVYGSIQTHSGAIEVVTKPKQGTSFNIYLPIQQKVDDLHVVQNISLALNKGDDKPLILLVDDKEELRATTGEVLVSLGYRVMEARDGEQALNLFESHKDEIDLIISDSVMPKMSGEKLHKAIREIRKEIPIILLTGYDKGRVIEGIQITDAHSMIMNKPLDIEKITETIQSLLSNR